MLLKGRAAVVTGAGRGIGRAVALALAKEGASVVVNDLGVDPRGDHPDPAPAETTAQDIRDLGGEALAHTGSVADVRSAENLIGMCVAEFGRIDILVNNAGLIIRDLVTDTSDEAWDRQIAANLRGPFLCSRAAAREMIPRGDGRIINFTSAAGLYSYPGSNAYTCAKAAVAAFTWMLAQELSASGIRVNAIAPGAATRMGEGVPEAVRELRGRLGVRPRSIVPEAERLPEPVAALVTYLASDEAAHINGRVIGVSGSRIDFWTPPEIDQTIFHTDLWTLTALRTHFARLLSAPAAPVRST